MSDHPQVVCAPFDQATHSNSKIVSCSIVNMYDSVHAPFDQASMHTTVLRILDMYDSVHAPFDQASKHTTFGVRVRPLRQTSEAERVSERCVSCWCRHVESSLGGRAPGGRVSRGGAGPVPVPNRPNGCACATERDHLNNPSPSPPLGPNPPSKSGIKQCAARSGYRGPVARGEVTGTSCWKKTLNFLSCMIELYYNCVGST